MAGEFHNLADASIKREYPPLELKVVANEEAPFKKWLKAGVPPGGHLTDGGYIAFNAYLRSPNNVGQSFDGGTWAPSKDRLEVQCVLKPSLFTASFQIGIMTAKAIKSNKSGFLGGEFKRRLAETLPNLGKFIEETYCAGMGNGVRAYVESDGVGYFICSQPMGANLIRAGHLISVRQGTGTTVRDSVDLIRVDSVNYETRALYYNIANETYGTNGDKTLVANDQVYVVVETTQSIAQTLGVGVFANGLRNLIDDGTRSQYFHTQDRTTTVNINLNSIVHDPGQYTSLTEENILAQAQKVYRYTGKKVTDLWSGEGLANEYAKIAAPDRQIVLSGTNPMKFGGGWNVERDFNLQAVGVDMKWHVSRDIVPGELYGLTPSTFFLYEAAPMDWWDQGGILKPIPGTNAYKAGSVAMLYSIENPGNYFPRANFVMRNQASVLDGLNPAI